MLQAGCGQYVLMPVFGLAAFILTVKVLGADRNSTLFSENGPVELGTAACFLLASGLALRLSFANDAIPTIYRILFRVFACVACFVALEELSYGQHIFGWRGPQFLTERSTKHEMNLHNLYGNCLSNAMRDVANVAFPFCCIVLPLGALRGRKQFDPTDWVYYLLPKTELITIVLLAQVMSPLDRLLRWWVGVRIRSGELQELFWSIAAVVYVWVIYRRTLRDTEQADVIPFRPIPVDQSELRKAA